MRSQLLLLVPLLRSGYAIPSPQEPDNDLYGDWQAPGPDDVRGPCPMINTLANHGFFPRDGGMSGPGYTREIVSAGLVKALNFDKVFADLVWTGGTFATPNPENATTWNLEQLSVHNVLEHDASLSRADAYFGSNVLFNQTVFDETTSYWHGNIIDAKMTADSKTGRQFSSRVNNPTYTFTDQSEIFSVGEMVSLILAFGDKRAVTARKDWLVYFFRGFFQQEAFELLLTMFAALENERFPTELGWTPPTNQVFRSDVEELQYVISNASSLITGENPVLKRKRNDFHAGRI